MSRPRGLSPEVAARVRVVGKMIRDGEGSLPEVMERFDVSEATANRYIRGARDREAHFHTLASKFAIVAEVLS